MADPTVRKPGQPKLRASCDNCGLLKLKCDRGQPECGRCDSLGLICVYGISRKTGKPRRSASRATGDAAMAQPRTLHARGNSTDKRRVDHRHGEIFLHTFDTGDKYFVMDSASSSNAGDLSSSWTTARGYDTHMTTLNATSEMQSNLVEEPLIDCSSFGFDDDLLSTPVVKTSSSSMDFQGPNVFSSSIPTSPRLQLEANANTNLANNAAPPLVCGRGNDCSREAYDILGKLNFYNDLSGSRSPPTPASTNSSMAERIPLDYILCINSDSRHRLSTLLHCSCARYSHLALLYASIISRMLTWYLEAAGCARKDLCSRFSATMSGAPMSQPSPSASLGGSTSYWPETTAGSVNQGDTIPSPGALGFRVTPIAMGAFQNDDQQVQTVLRIQILLGEIKKTGSLINLFISRCSVGVDGTTLSEVDTLYRTLNTLLNREQSRIAGLVRSKVKDVTI